MKLMQRVTKKIIARAIAICSEVFTIIMFISEINKSHLNLKDVLVSFNAFVCYVVFLIIIIGWFLYEKYEKLLQTKKILKKQVEELNQKLNEESAKLDSAMRWGKTKTFKNKYFLTTEKLYSELADKIQNSINISSMNISNTIEKKGIGEKRDSIVKLSILGVVTKEDVYQFQLLAAGDSIVKWESINLKAYEEFNNKLIKLKARVADNGQDSYLKQVVISYSEKKKKGDIVKLEITWKWPNMLSISSDDYITLPVVLSPITKNISMFLKPKMDLTFDELSIYKFTVENDQPTLIRDLSQEQDGSVTFTDDNPQFKSCYILYYKIAHA